MNMEELEHRVKQLEWCIFIICILIGAGIIYTFIPRPYPISQDTVLLQQLTDSMKVHDKVRDSVSAANQRRWQLQDSIRIEGIRNQVNDVPSLVTRINNRYNDKRNHIITLSTDQQLVLFSDWLSTQDSL